MRIGTLHASIKTGTKKSADKTAHLAKSVKQFNAPPNNYSVQRTTRRYIQPTCAVALAKAANCNRKHRSLTNTRRDQTCRIKYKFLPRAYWFNNVSQKYAPL